MIKPHVFCYSATGTAKDLALAISGELAKELSGELPGGASAGLPVDPVGEKRAKLESNRLQASGTPPAQAPHAARLLNATTVAEGVTDLLRHPPQKDLCFGPDDLLVITSPVYSGRLPAPMRQRLEKLHGASTPVIIAMTYGDRAYDDALLELADLLEERGFVVIGAGAFIARHAVFPRYAVGRPDESDLSRLRELARKSLAKLVYARAGRDMHTEPVAQTDPRDPAGLADPATQGSTVGDASAGQAVVPAVAALSVRGVIKGKRPYMKPQELPIYPRPDSKCVGCGTCARLCPVSAIDPAKLKARPAKHCLACAACIHACPQGSRKFRGPFYHGLDLLFLALSKVMKSKRKEPEIFV